MATTKTIQPTRATITIPEFTDQPDIRPVATDLSNITDAANALNDRIGNLNIYETQFADANPATYTCDASSSYLVIIATNTESFSGVYLVYTGGESAYIYAIKSASAITPSASGLAITFTKSSSKSVRFIAIKL